MLLFSITMAVVALVCFWLVKVGTIGSGALLFVAGFVVLGAIAFLNYARSRRPTVF